MPDTGQDEGTIERLIAGTHSPDVFTRLRAAQQLGAAGDTRAVEPLMALLHDPAREVIEAALISLGNLGDLSAVEPIAAVFSDRDMMATMGRAIAISTAAAEALRKLGGPGFQALIQLLREHSDSEFEGLALIGALNQIKDPRSLDALAIALHSPVYEVGHAAAGALLVQFGETVVPLLVTSLTTTERYTADHARQALSGYRPALSHLLELLRTSEIAYVRARAVLAIASIDDPQVPDILRSALADADDEVRNTAVEALGERRDPSVVEQVLDLPVPAGGGQDPAVHILAEFGPEVAAALLDALNDPEHPAEARARAAEALGGVGAMDAVEPLISALRDNDERVRCAAAGALGQLGDTRAVEPLLQALSTGPAGVQTSALWALLGFDDLRAFDAVAAAVRNPHEDRRLRIAVIVNPRFNHKSGALPVLRQLALAAHGDPRENSEAYYLALAALGPLSRLGPSGIRAAVEVAQSSETLLCLHALRQLQQSSTPLDEDAVEQVAALLSDPRTPVRRQAAIVLGEHGDPRAMDPLIESLRHPAPEIRKETARVLGKVGGERAVPALEQALAETRNAEVSPSQQRSAKFELRDTIQRAILEIRTRQHEQATQLRRPERES